MGFWPNERGQYNYDVKPTSLSAGIDANGLLLKPETRWGGIMRRLETNDFQSANIEYIQFWLMDPFNEDYDVKTDPNFDKNNYPDGDLYINLGNISEDIVKDGRMTYENGLPGSSSTTQNLPIIATGIADVPAIPPTINAFSSDNNDRPFQDVGYDGMPDSTEQRIFANAVNDISGTGYNANAPAIIAFKNDPSNDNYNFFRDDDYDAAQERTIVRYSKYNNPQGNSPTESQYNNANPNGEIIQPRLVTSQTLKM